ncbi:MAG: D-alanine--D-alanine ligase [Bacteroidia bacterium]
MKLKIGILFGGRSKEREISFAGGRTVYDNLNKSLFEAVPLFIDSFNQIILLDWQYIYKGSIRDFYPDPSVLPQSHGEYQVYAESLPELNAEHESAKLGRIVSPSELKNLIDVAFLCLHGPYGEDGRIQGLLEFLDIPYTGSGIYSSSIGISKVIQKKLMEQAGFPTPAWFTVERSNWLKNRNAEEILKSAEAQIGFPLVVKSPTQGSSIGVSVIHSPSEAQLSEAIDKSLFIRRINASTWNAMNAHMQNEWIRTVCDIREGIGIPVRVNGQIIHHPDALQSFIRDAFANGSHSELYIESLDAEAEVILEGFIEGKEFSSIVIEDMQGNPVCLPPTEIRKGKEVFDYRSKYLPGLSRKITPIELPDADLERIRETCARLFSSLGFGVYARIDGFIKADGTIYLNDPNTTSGMMPSSFFFHQAAEIGFNPSQFITYIIHTSLRRRTVEMKFSGIAETLLARLDEAMHTLRTSKSSRKRIAVVFGGYSSERHISVESGRNVYEKLSSSSVFEPVPVFLSGSDNAHELYTLPINLMLKDNADDIREKILHFSTHPIILKIIRECGELTQYFGDTNNLNAPRKLDYQALAAEVQEVFIALHGRPGEDGALQRELVKIGLPYNGSNADSSAITIDKFRTNEILKENGMLVAEHFVVRETEWQTDNKSVLAHANAIGYPLIAKPVDDGCSSAVKKLHNDEDFIAFTKLIFRTEEQLDAAASERLKIKPKEEFPSKHQFLVESLIQSNGAPKFIEITGGMVTHLEADGSVRYEVFEASEALSEGEVLSLEEKFLAGQGQNITPARYAADKQARQRISDKVKKELERAARVLNVQGYCRIDAFVRVYEEERTEVIFIELNSLPGMTPATCIFHQCAINGYKPYDFIEKIMTFAEKSANSSRLHASL